MGFEDFAELRGVDVQIATEDGSRGVKGLVTELLETALSDSGPAHVYACGPTPMMRRAAEVAHAHSQRCTVSLENNMACGFGVCLGCAAPLTEGGLFRNGEDQRGAPASRWAAKGADYPGEAARTISSK